jgi:phosphoglycerate dehydrogenase-like enzyme
MHPDVTARLRQVAEVASLPSDRESLARALASGCDGIIAYVPDLDPPDLARAPELRAIACHDCPRPLLEAASERGIRVTYAPSLRDTVADMALALLFAAARNVPQAHAAIAGGLWGREDLKVRFSGFDVFGKTLGILGLGRIGAILARRVQGFEMRILYHDLVRKPELERELGLQFRSLGDLLAEADIVVVLVRLNEDSRGMIGEPELRSMKRDAILVNVARGAILDQAALYRALQERWIAAAGLDVLVEEPIGADHPLLALDNVVLAPHLGGSTKGCDMVLVEDTIRVLHGEEPLHPLK